jgi:hypothetical protein
MGTVSCLLINMAAGAAPTMKAGNPYCGGEIRILWG